MSESPNPFVRAQRAREAAGIRELEFYLAQAPVDQEQGLSSACPDCLRSRYGHGRGHQLHYIQGRHIGQRPEGWRTIVAEAVDGRCLRGVDLEGNTVELWHHAPLDAMITVGDQLLLHELWALVLPDGVALPVGYVTQPPPLLAPPDCSRFNDALVLTDLATGYGRLIPREDLRRHRS